jgi:AraC family transcriptional regulator
MQAALVRYGPDEVWPEHVHDRLSISVVLAGSLFERVGRDEEQAALGSLVVKPAGSLHSNRFGPSGAVFLAIWPDETLVEHLAGKTPSSWRWRHDRRGLRKWIGIARELHDADPWGVAEEEVIALMADEESPAGRVSDASPRLRRVRDEIHALQPGRPSIGALARSAGLHPVSLTRSFRRHYGCSISAYVRRLRIEQAAAMLIARKRCPLTTIAHELGFADQSHFCRTFAAELGIAPNRYRRTMDSARAGR